MLTPSNELIENNPNIWIVTVNWNQPLLTQACVQSLREKNAGQFSLVIVDNGSTDRSIEVLQDIPASTLIQNPINLGFAGGFNVGIKYALTQGADYVFIVNNDTISQDQMLDILVTTAIDLMAEIAAPAIFYTSSPNQIWSAGGKINPLLSAPIDSHSRKKPLPTNPERRDFFTGCALLIHKRVFERLGFLDEGFFLYYEDLDFFMRAKNMRLSAWLIPKAKLLHHVSASIAIENTDHFYFWMGYSSCRYFCKHAKWWQWIFVLPWQFSHTLKMIAHFFFSGRYNALSAHLKGIITFIFKQSSSGENNNTMN